MRTISDSLLKAQQTGFLNPLCKVVLTKGESSYTYEKDRILPSEHDEEMYSHRAKIVLHNRDHALDDIDLRGYDAVISYGFADEYSATAPLSVIDQQFDSDPNNLTCILELEGTPNLMAQDEASENYIPESDADEKVKDLVEAIAGATLAPFTHCTAFEVVWDEGYDDLADTYEPADDFRIYTGGNRLAAIRKLLDYTSNVARFEADGKIHIMKPVTTGTTYDSEYALGKGYHNFFNKAYRNTLVIPNRVVVQSRSDDEPFYQGEAQTDDYDSLPAKVKKTKFVEARLESDDQGDDIAEALLSKAEMGCSRGQAEVPINVAAEVFDYDKVTDSRQGDARTGNVGYIHRRFGGDKWKMTFGFGNWFDLLHYQAMLNELETYTDIDNYFSRLRVGTLYAYLDDIKDGPEIYIRQRSMQLDATGLYLQENIVYTIRLPGEAQHKLTKSDTAPSSPEEGDFWIDTNYIPNPIMIWNGSSWDELTAEEIAEYNRATIFREVKSMSLTADGLVLLDQVQVGTYGLVLATAISAGNILLSKTEKDGLWYDETGVAINATTGIGLYGGAGINAFRTYPTKQDYLDGTNVLCYIGTDGRLSINGPGSLRFYHDSFYAGCLGVSNTSPYEFNILAMGGNPLYIGTEGDPDGGDIYLNPGSNYVLPYADNDIRLGSPSKQFYGGYFASRLVIPHGLNKYD